MDSQGKPEAHELLKEGQRVTEEINTIPQESYGTAVIYSSLGKAGEVVALGILLAFTTQPTPILLGVLAVTVLLLPLLRNEVRKRQKLTHSAARADRRTKVMSYSLLGLFAAVAIYALLIHTPRGEGVGMQWATLIIITSIVALLPRIVFGVGLLRGSHGPE